MRKPLMVVSPTELKKGDRIVSLNTHANGFTEFHTYQPVTEIMVEEYETAVFTGRDGYSNLTTYCQNKIPVIVYEGDDE